MGCHQIPTPGFYQQRREIEGCLGGLGENIPYYHMGYNIRATTPSRPHLRRESSAVDVFGEDVWNDATILSKDHPVL